MKLIFLVLFIVGVNSCKPESEISVMDTTGGSSGGDIDPIDDIPDGADNFYIESVLAFKEHVFPVLRTHCSTCHRSNAETPRPPFFADAKIAKSHDAIIDAGKIIPGSLTKSRLYKRAKEDKHNCETYGCDKLAEEILTVLQRWEPNLDLRSFKPQGVVSTLVKISDGTDVTTDYGIAPDTRELAGKKVELKFADKTMDDISVFLEIYEDKTDNDFEGHLPRYLVKNISIQSKSKPIAFSGIRVHINEGFQANANKLVVLTGVILPETEENITEDVLGQEFTEELTKYDGIELDSIQVSFERLQVFK